MASENAVPARTLRVAIFGAGNMAMHHLKAISLQANASVVALADPAIDMIRKGTELPPDLPLFSDPEELLAKIKPDVVHVCTPPSTHAGLSALALRHQANIYVEKPFALNLSDATEIISLAEKAGLGVCAGHQLLFEAPARNAIAEIGKLGRIVHVESYFSFNPIKGTQDGRPTMPPLDQLVDILPHPVYLLLYFMKCTLRKEDRDRVRMKSVVVDPRGDVYGILQARRRYGQPDRDVGRKTDRMLRESDRDERKPACRLRPRKRRHHRGTGNVGNIEGPQSVPTILADRLRNDEIPLQKGLQETEELSRPGRDHRGVLRSSALRGTDGYQPCGDPPDG